VVPLELVPLLLLLPLSSTVLPVETSPLPAGPLLAVPLPPPAPLLEAMLPVAPVTVLGGRLLSVAPPLLDDEQAPSQRQVNAMAPERTGNLMKAETRSGRSPSFHGPCRPEREG